MSEDEAKTKWCPFARVAGQMGSEAQGTSFNRWTTGAAGGAADPAACIGSACMAWRVTERIEVRHKHTGQVVPPDAWRMRGDYEETKVADGGYCGLAGKP